ncbi:MAG: glycine cleavage system protein H [Firmicutes bacterium HGW-Firmicutes-16]|nr:MAG: glycine cleavage system protein H [Firmicutes bacterium HGW-Firmicutes-16]
MNTPKNLKYSDTHEWVEFLDDGIVKIGLTDYAQKKLGKLVFVNLPLVGDVIAIDEAFSDVESVKAVSDVLAPIDGTVVEINEALLDAPGMINDDPYSAWLVKVTVISENGELMDSGEYEDFCAKEE